MSSLDPTRTADHLAASSCQSNTVNASQPEDSTDATAPYTPVSPDDAPNIPGYVITFEIAQGGMGRVYAGRDLTLDREVAIKTLLPGSDVERFVKEAKITAKLPHPNIPPVHALGTQEDGPPWLAMKLIRGRTLSELLKERKSPKESLARFVQVFEQIAQALGFAHSREIIHRDLKPLNVMVGEFGEVQVMDWGLAKDHVASSDGQKSGATEFDDGPHLTQAGAIMGTPGYMSPEQARGEPVDPRTDVFALGATLAAILTGKPAFVGASARDTIDKAAAAKLDDVLARLNACGADNELVSLAKKCLAAKPQDRPADAREVAAEVAAYRANVEARLQQAETERARAETTAAEQDKRRRVVQWASGLIAMVLLVGILGTTWGLVAARQQTAVAQKQKELARAESAKKELALQAETKAKKDEQQANEELWAGLNAMTADIVGNTLGTQKNLSAEQKRFLANVLPLYRRLANKKGRDPATRSQVAAAASRVGAIQDHLGNKLEGVAAFQESLQEYESLVADFPNDVRYRVSLANSCTNLGLSCAGLRRSEEAEMYYQEGLELLEHLVSEFPDDPGYLTLLSANQTNYGNTLKDVGRLREAEIQYRAALAIDKRLATTYPNDQGYRAHLAQNHGNLGIVLRTIGDTAEAVSQFQTGLAVLELLANESSNSPENRADMARFHNNMGILYFSIGQNATAEKHYRNGLAILENLAAEFPAVPEFREGSGRLRIHLGELLAEMERTADAQEQYATGLTIRENLAKKFPDVPEYQVDLAKSYSSLGKLLTKLDKLSDAEQQFRKGLAIHEKLSTEFSGVLAYAENVAAIHSNLGWTLDCQGQSEAAETHYQEALSVREKMALDFPDIPRFRVELGGSYCHLGHLIQRRGQAIESLQWYEKAIAILGVVHLDETENRTAQQFLRNSHAGRALAHDQLNQFAEAAKEWARVVELSPSQEQPSLRSKQADSLLRAGQLREAVAIVQELIELDGWQGSQLYGFASVYAMAATKDEMKEQEYVNSAVSLLKKAVDAGYGDIAQMKNDTHLDGLRDREDFQELLTHLKAKEKK